MHIICPREELQKGVSIVSKAVSNKTTMPILECILIQTKEGRILMTANDMELGIETEIHGIIEDNGRIAIDAKIFSEIVRRLPDNDISIETDGTDSVKIQCEKINFTIPGKNYISSRGGTLKLCYTVSVYSEGNYPPNDIFHFRQ